MNTKNIFQSIPISTCEDASIGKTQQIPTSGKDLFSIFDPFGLRKAIVPILLRESDGRLKGMGTAFHIDGWGTFITADHVIDAVRKNVKHTKVNQEVHFISESLETHPILLLSAGVVCGRAKYPNDAVAVIKRIRTLATEKDDPLATLRGESRFIAASDIAVMQIAHDIPKHMVGTLPLRFSGWRPKKDDYVIAFGFPDLQLDLIDVERENYKLSDSMSASYGRILEVHPYGRGNDPTPVIEVEANWPSGMSGGPVFNDCGEVIGIVSRSLPPSGDVKGNGTAVCFELLPWLNDWIPTLDKNNPSWRLGWLVQHKISSKVIGFHKDETEALSQLANLGEEYEVAYGSNRIGTEDFILKVSLE